VIDYQNQDFTVTQVIRPKHGKSAKNGNYSFPNQNGNLKLTRSQINVHKISLAAANASYDASSMGAKISLIVVEWQVNFGFK